ncbi:MAG: class I SAM-dependent methyltransferase, partial [Roseiflexaceae bacterium]
KRTGAIHRVVRLPAHIDIENHDADTVHAVLVRELHALPVLDAVADLGCGVGASMRAVVAAVAPTTHVSGITISAIQATHVPVGSVLVASFEALPYADASLNAVWAIESFAHAQNPALFFTEVARVLRPGGRCIICDDMRLFEHASPFIDAFQQGWMVPNIATVEQHQHHAHGAGLAVCNRIDLSAGLTIRALPSWVATWIVQRVLPLVVSSLFLRSMIGSMALQQCYQQQIMRYEFIVFEKQHASP